MKTTLLITALLLGYSSMAQVTFQPQTSGTTQSLKGTTIIPGTSIGWASGAGGTILYTSDGGTTWTAQSSGVTATLEDIFWGATASGGLQFVWACGSTGTILGTSDGGSTWEIQSEGAPIALYSVDFQNVSNGFVVGATANASTTNGGNMWSPQMTSTTLMAVDFVSTSVGYACGTSGTILKTVDGGMNWSNQTSGTSLALYGINFINENEGWACGITGTILHTTNGGTTWTAQTSNTENLIHEIVFFDAMNGWAVGYSGTILHTTDGGATWTFYHSGLTGTVAELTSIALISATEGWVVGSSGTIIHFEYNGSSAGVESLEEVSLNVYPNPTSSTLTIETAANIESIQILNINGTLIQTETVANFSVEALMSGVYFICVKTTEGVITKRFVKV